MQYHVLCTCGYLVTLTTCTHCFNSHFNSFLPGEPGQLLASPRQNYLLKVHSLYRKRQLYKNISMLLQFPVNYGKLTGVNAQRFLAIVLRLVFDNRKLPYKTT